MEYFGRKRPTMIIYSNSKTLVFSVCLGRSSGCFCVLGNSIPSLKIKFLIYGFEITDISLVEYLKSSQKRRIWLYIFFLLLIVLKKADHIIVPRLFCNKSGNCKNFLLFIFTLAESSFVWCFLNQSILSIGLR